MTGRVSPMPASRHHRRSQPVRTWRALASVAAAAGLTLGVASSCDDGVGDDPDSPPTSPGPTAPDDPSEGPAGVIPMPQSPADNEPTPAPPPPGPQPGGEVGGDEP